jgi:mannose-6-phosphate isomerase
LGTLLNAVSVKRGDVYFIPPRVVHAIGYGRLILEVQEPTDFTIQPEAWCGEYRLNEYERFLGLDRDTALECFDYSAHGEAAAELSTKKPALVKAGSGLVPERLIGPGDTDCFAINRHRLQDGALAGLTAPAIYLVTGGEGALTGPDGSHPLKKGGYFLLPRLRNDILVDFGKCSVFPLFFHASDRYPADDVFPC